MMASKCSRALSYSLRPMALMPFSKRSMAWPVRRSGAGGRLVLMEVRPFEAEPLKIARPGQAGNRRRRPLLHAVRARSGRIVPFGRGAVRPLRDEPISIRGARVHNLQGVDCDLPRNRLV